MQLTKVRRRTRQRKYFTEDMGMLNAKVTQIQKTFLNIPVKTIHEYRETYYGEVKDTEECTLSK